VASFDGLPLDLNNAGAVLLLSRPSTIIRHDVRADGIEVHVADGSRAVRVGGIDPSTPVDEVATEARDAADRALDLVAVNGGGGFVLSTAERAAVAWTGRTPATIMRAYDNLHMQFSMTATAVVMDADGVIVPPPPSAAPTWHESMRYFRMSQSTGDLLDAFRNIYLALESILSEIAPYSRVHPMTARYESEKAWLNRALQDAEQLMQARGGLPKVEQRFEHAPTGDPIDALCDELYSAHRTATFHAKTNRQTSLPQRQADRAGVAEILQRYSGLYADIAQAKFGTRFPRSGVGSIVAESLVTTVSANDFWLTSEGYADPADLPAVPPRDALRLHTARSSGHDTAFSRAVIGSVAVADVPAQFAVRGFAAFGPNSGPVMIAGDLGGRLILDGAATFEYLIAVSVSGRAFKRVYET
jgi:hypothetical protein